MNKTKIDWADMTWNPVTGCLHGCPYCYARRVAERFGRDYAPRLGDPGMEGACKYDSEAGMDTMLEIKKPYVDDTGKKWAYPMAFMPTFHRYRLGDPERKTAGQDIFVCSMADLFGRWVPVKWIMEIMDACQRAPQHRYLFLTKNPARYLELDHLALLPHSENFLYGSTVTSEDMAAMYPMPHVSINTFWSMEPLLGPVDMTKAEGLPQWVIVGAETGNRADKVTPRREWVDKIAAFCDENEIPVFYKGNLRDIYPDLAPSAFQWEA